MKSFKLKELIFITLIVALMFVIAYILIPLMAMLPLPAYRALLVAPIYGGGVLLATNRAKKFGTITVIGILLGVILSIFTVFMLFVSIIAGILTDLICGLPFQGYRREANCIVAAGLFPGLQIPLVFYFMAYTLGGVFNEYLSRPVIIFMPALVTFCLGAISAKAILKMWKKRRINGQIG